LAVLHLLVSDIGQASVQRFTSMFGYEIKLQVFAAESPRALDTTVLTVAIIYATVHGFPAFAASNTSYVANMKFYTASCCSPDTLRIGS
jgi:hypothetical protein